MNPKYIIGTGIILICLVFAGLNLDMTPYVSLEEAAENTDETVQVKGTRVVDSETFDLENGTFQFQMQDANGQVFQVIYDEPKPSNFERAQEVVAIGHYADGAFHADKLLIKCPSKYESEFSAEGEHLEFEGES